MVRNQTDENFSGNALARMPLQPGLGTHFNAPIPLDTLMEIAGFGFRWARMDAMECSHATMLTMIADVESVGLTPLTIVYDLDRLHAAPWRRWYEWGNEFDGDMLPRDYRLFLDAAVEMAVAEEKYLLAPVISNLDWNSLAWMAAVRGEGWPPGLAGISVHRYGDGSFEWSHPPFASRDTAVEHLLTLCDGLPVFVTEFGYPSHPAGVMNRTARRTRYLQKDLNLSELQQAERIGQEWDFWHRWGVIPFLYQVNDGLHPDEAYGIRRCAPDGTLTDWKPAAYLVPKEEPPMPEPITMPTANAVFSKADLVEVPGSPGDFGLRYPIGAETILSPKASGNHELRDMTYLGGPDETCRVNGDLIYFHAVDGRRFAWRLVEEA